MNFIKVIVENKYLLRLMLASIIIFLCFEAFHVLKGPKINLKSINKFVQAINFRTKKNITFNDILKSDQHDPDLINYLKTNVIKPPSGKPYNLAKPNVEDSSQFKQGAYLKEYFKNKKSGTFIEVGAYDGEDLSNTLILERQLGWTGLLIEPIPELFRSLSTKNRKAYTSQSCLSLTAFPSTLEMSSDTYLSQIIDSSIPKTNKLKTLKINCFPLYSLMVAANITTLDFISLDIESFEVKILKTIPWSDVNIKTLLIEINHIPEGTEYLKKFMSERNYTLKHNFPIDFFFVKNS